VALRAASCRRYPAVAENEIERDRFVGDVARPVRLRAPVGHPRGRPPASDSLDAGCERAQQTTDEHPARAVSEQDDDDPQHDVAAHDDRFEIREQLLDEPRVRRWRAFDRLLECEVVLEQPGPALAGRLGSGRGAARALREARALAKLQHPGIVRLREVGARDGLPLLVLEARGGETLAERLRARERLDPDEVVRIGRELADALQAVHAAGVVHRNVAAHHVLFDPTDGRAVLGGFGFAKPFDRPGGLSSIDHGRRQEGAPAPQGLPDYAAPEQVAGHAADARADVFALGCLLYRCATGQEAFAADQVEWSEPVPLRRLVPEAPRALESAISRSLQRSPAARFPTMQAFVDALAGAYAATPSRGVPTGLALAALVLLALVSIPFAYAFARPGHATDGGEGATSSTRSVDDPALLESYAPRIDRGRAVVIGIGYADNPAHAHLPNAENDARAVHDALLALGWSVDDVVTLLGSEGTATKQAIDDALRDAFLGAAPDDQVFVFFAGHGALDDRVAEGVVVDGDLVAADGGTRDTKKRWIPFRELRALVDRTRAKHVLVALACCHAGAAVRGVRVSETPPGDLPPPLVQERLRTRARVWLTAAEADETATDGDPDEGTSPFAAGIVRALTEAAEGRPVTSRLLHAYVWQEDTRQSRPQHCRHHADPKDSEFVFLPPR
jgi:hypothetical protein